MFSSRKIEKGTYESIPFRYVAGGLHPDHDTIAHFRKAFLEEIGGLFVKVLLIAEQAGVLTVGNVSLDASKIHADASKSHAVSYGRLLELETQLKGEVQELLALGEQADQGEVELPQGLVIEEEITLRRDRLGSLADLSRFTAFLMHASIASIPSARLPGLPSGQAVSGGMGPVAHSL